MNTEIQDVYNLYVDTAINQVKNENGKGDNRVWVTSQTASWH